MTRLCFEAVARLGQSVHSAPDEAVDGHDGGGHHDGSGKKKVEVPGIGGLADRRAKSNGGVGLAFEMEVFGYDAGIPRTA